MPLIDYPVMDDLDAETREVLDGARNPAGEIPAFPRMLANNPDVLKAALGQFAEVMYGGNLPPDLKQLAFVVVSQANECAYCAASHGEELVTAFGQPAARLEALAEHDHRGLSDRERAVAAFARQGATDPKRMGAEHLEALRAVGFDDADIIELLAVVAQASFANTIADAMHMLPGDQSPQLEQYYPRPVPADG